MIGIANLKDFISKIIAPNYGRPGLSCWKSSRVRSDFFNHLRQDAKSFVQRHQPSEIDDDAHALRSTNPYGTARMYSVFNRTGNPSDFSADNDWLYKGKAFHQPEEYPALAKFIGSFPHLINFRINVMGGNSGLSFHNVTTLVKAEGQSFIVCRFHCPIITNEKAKMILEWKEYHFEEGDVYFFNNAAPHTGKNDGAETRVHLVWDVKLTKKSWPVLFGGQAPADIFEYDGTCGKEPTPTTVLKPQPYRTAQMYFGLYKGLHLKTLGISEMTYQHAIDRIRSIKKTHYLQLPPS